MEACKCTADYSLLPLLALSVCCPLIPGSSQLDILLFETYIYIINTHFIYLVGI